MQLLAGRNINSIWPMARTLLSSGGMQRVDTRNGRAVKSRTPVTTHYLKPQERVLFDAKRDANPFFHLAESLWMLAGQRDVAFVSQFVKRMAEYSDDGETFHSAYGWRWRNHFSSPNDHTGEYRDQLDAVVQQLAKDPHSRRAVIGIWDPAMDLNKQSKDLPCNLGAKVWLENQHTLHLMVYNRSNDVAWGAYGANAVQFSMLQEYLAMRLGVRMGELWQVSGDWHMYEALLETKELWQYEAGHDVEERYERGEAVVVPFDTGFFWQTGDTPEASRAMWAQRWEQDLMLFVLGAKGRPVHPQQYQTAYFRAVVNPMMQAFWERTTTPLNTRFDWHVAGAEWLMRRKVPDTRNLEEE